MAFAERKKMGNKYRQAVTATVLTYIDTAKQLNQDPLGLVKLSPVGTVLLGAELGFKLNKKMGPDDSVWWITVNPANGTIVKHKQLAADLSAWRKKLNKQLKAWDQKSAVKQLTRKRATTAGIVAAIVVAVVVVSVLTVGAGTAGAAAGGAAAANAAAVATVGGTSGTALGTAAGTGGTAALLPALKAIGAAASAGGSLAQQAQAGKASLPPEYVAAVDQDAASVTEQVETDIAAPDESDSNSSSQTTTLIAVGAVAAVALIGLAAVVGRKA